MNRDRESRAFGLDRGRTLAYRLDNYSTPDKWYYIGYELQYQFNLHLDMAKEGEDEADFLGKLIDVFQQGLGLPHDEHYALGVPEGDKGILLKIYWDKGPLDLRLLTKCEDRLNAVAVLSHVNVEFISLVIIPRSRQTLVLRMQGKL